MFFLLAMIPLASNINSLSKQYCYPPIPRNGGVSVGTGFIYSDLCSITDTYDQEGKTDLK